MPLDGTQVAHAAALARQAQEVAAKHKPGSRVRPRVGPDADRAAAQRGDA